MDAEQPPRGALRHWGGFLVSGLIAFAVDAGMLEIGVRLLGLDPLVARVGAISSAMVAGWLAHRRFTFAIDTPPTLSEFARYAMAGWSSAAINYFGFAGILLFSPDTSRMVALVAASVVSMIFAYVAMRYAVFRISRASDV